jgi:outer membrane protein TolC
MRNRTIFSLVLLLSLPTHAGAQQPQSLSLKQAVEAALEPVGNTQVQLAAEAVRMSEAQSAEVRSQLLPDLSASLGKQQQTRSLSAMGLGSDELPDGLQLPRVVGPYNTVDARATVSHKVLDLGALRRYQASKAGVGAAKQENEVARNDAAAEVARFYLAAVRAQAMLDTARANVTLAEKLLQLAVSQKQAGTGTGIEVTRAEVQLANDRQALFVAQAGLTKARLELLRTIGLGMDAPFALADPLTYSPAVTRSFNEAMALAQEALPSLRAQKERERSASLNYSAAGMDRLPTVTAFADYGATGLKVSETQATRTAGISLNIPIFDGGARQARRAESLSLLRQEQLRTADLQREVELRIRVALDAVNSAEAQVQAAEVGLTLSLQELEQAQRRYTAGVTSSVEVTDAQTRLQRARENQIAALFNHALARVDLGAATGTIQQLINNWR